MTDLFLRIVELSWQAGVLALAVMLARLALRRAPKWAVCLLWVLVAVRLVLPFSLQSPVSLQAAQSPVTAALCELPQTQAEAQKTDEVLSGGATEPLTPRPPVVLTETVRPVPAAKPAMTLSLLAAVWLAGVAVMLTYLLASYLRIYHQVRTAVRLEDNVYRCDRWGTPFVLGVFRPRIYVPVGVDEADLPQVLAHERCHIRRGDHAVKPLAFLLLAVHWFNPVLWAAYILLGRDMENACDERVLRTLDSAGRAAYSRALVACAVQERPAAVCPLAFGETAVKERVKNAMNGKKPAVWAAVLLAIAAVIIGVCFLTSPDRREADLDSGTVGGAAGAAFEEITPWPSETENDPVSIDPADYGIIYDTEHLPDWETCPLSYLCAYYLGSNGAYTEGAADTLAQRYRQAPNTVRSYLNKLAAKYEGVDGQILSQIQLTADNMYGIEPTVDVQNGAASALEERLTETLTGYFLMRANAIAGNNVGTAYCVEKLRWDALSRRRAAVWPYVAADDLRAVHVTVDVTEVRTLNDGGTRLVLEELTMLDYGTGSDQYGWGTTHRLEIHEDRADVPRVTWDAYDESDLGDGHVSQDQQTDISAAAMDMAITGPWTGLVTDTRTEQAGGTEYHLICIAGRWFGGTVQELGTPAQVGDLVSVWNYAAAGGDFEPLWQQELLERGSGGKTTEVFRRGDGLAVQLTCVHETQEDSEPAVYTLLSSAELSVLSLPSDVSYKLYGADGSIRAMLTEGAVIPLTEQDGGIGAEHAYVLQFSWLT